MILFLLLHAGRKGIIVAVRIRMTRLGRRHRPYFRIVATDSRAPRDGRYIEDLGFYDPMLANTDARVTLKAGRINYWLSVGAQPSEKVALLLKSHLAKFEKAEAESEAAHASAETGDAQLETSSESGD